MARIRTIKPDFWTDGAVVSVSPFARLLFLGIWNYADDWGVVKDDSHRLRLQVLPSDTCNSEELISELVEANLLVRMVAPDGTRVLVVRSFQRHQKIDKRSAPTYGEPATFSLVNGLNDGSGETGEVGGPHRIPPNPPDSRQSPPTEGKGREGKGRETTKPLGVSENENAERRADSETDLDDLDPTPEPVEPSKPILTPPTRAETLELEIVEPPILRALPSKAPDLLCEALAAVCGIDLAKLTRGGRGALNGALGDLRRVGATPEEIPQRARRYRQRFPKATLTPSALAKHWASLSGRGPLAPDDPLAQAVARAKAQNA